MVNVTHLPLQCPKTSRDSNWTIEIDTQDQAKYKSECIPWAWQSGCMVAGLTIPTLCMFPRDSVPMPGTSLIVN